MKTLVYTFSLCASLPVQAQNLVANGDFEEYNECPDFWNQMERATGWSRYRGSPDYYHACDVGGNMGVPANVAGHQLAASGQAYAGVLLWCDQPANNREHAGAMLSTPLQPGVPVHVSFKVSPTTEGPSQNMRWSTAGAGLRFVTEPYLQDGLAELPNNAALYMTATPLDTSLWYQVSGTYIPDSAYQFVVIGNFLSDSLIDPVILNLNGTLNCAYVYYDDICVSYDPAACGIPDVIEEQFQNWKMHAYPVPYTDVCTIDFGREVVGAVTLRLCDQQGRSVSVQVLVSSGRKLQVSFPPHMPGVYTLHATTPMGDLPPVVLVHISP